MADSTDQSDMNTDCTPHAFDKSIRKAEFSWWKKRSNLASVHEDCGALLGCSQSQRNGGVSLSISVLGLQIVAVCVTLMVAEVGRMTAGPDVNRRLDGRKVRTPQGRVLGNTQGG